MNLKFLTDWDEAAEHPAKTFIAVFLLTFPGLAALAFWFLSDRHLIAALVLAGFAATGFALVTYSLAHRLQPKTSEQQGLSAGGRRWITILICAGSLLSAVVGATGAPSSLAVAVTVLGSVATMVVIAREVRTRRAKNG